MQRHGDAGHDSNHITNLLGIKQYTNHLRGHEMEAVGCECFHVNRDGWTKTWPLFAIAWFLFLFLFGYNCLIMVDFGSICLRYSMQ